MLVWQIYHIEMYIKMYDLWLYYLNQWQAVFEMKIFI